MKKLKFSLLLITITSLSCFTSLNAQWYDKSNGLPDYYGYANAIDAYDSLIATGPYTLAPSYIPDSLYLTTDGGNSWYTRPLPGNLERHDDLYDISIIGKDKIWFGTGKGKIYNTTDGGFNWQLQFYDTLKSTFINYIEMFDSLNGMAMGNANYWSNKPALFLKTTNGGTDWISQNDSYFLGAGSGDLWRRVDFININTGYFLLSRDSIGLYKTTNSGQDWHIYKDSTYLNVIKAYNENIFLCEQYNGGTSGTIYRTTNGGQNWESYIGDFLAWGFDIEYIPGNPANVWYASYDVSFSSDTGRTWGREFNLDNFFFRDIVFTDEYNGWLLANKTASSFKTRIFRTTNGGHGGIVSVDDNQSNLIVSNYILEQNYPNPFNPTTTIKYQIPELSFVTIKVYDVLGSEVATLINEEKPVGSYEFEFDGTKLPSGVYFYRLTAAEFSDTKKLILLK